MMDSTLTGIDSSLPGEEPTPGTPLVPTAPLTLSPAPSVEEQEPWVPMAGGGGVSRSDEATAPLAMADGAIAPSATSDTPTGEAGPGLQSEPTIGEPLPAPADTASDPAVDRVTEVETGVTAAALVDALLETAAPRRHKRRQPERTVAQGSSSEPAATADAGEHQAADGSTVGSAMSVEHATIPSDDLDDPAWRERWPDNAVHMVARVLPRISDAPALDGVQRTRVELALVEQHGDEFGSVGTLPIFVMPGAPGFGPILREITQARRQKRRLKPMMVELHGILRQMPDRDTRYANARYTILMGVEVHKITRVSEDAEQFAYWRGRAQVIRSRRYAYRGIAYQRVTAVVVLKQRKARLRGTSVTHVPVDFLVAPEHEHADRFRHIGQRLLIEANVAADVHRMNDNHPDLEGIDDPRRRAQLQVLRESVVTVTMGEFPDEDAERAYRAWVKAGRPGPERQGRPRGSEAVQPGANMAAHGTNDGIPVSGPRAQTRKRAAAGRSAGEEPRTAGPGAGDGADGHASRQTSSSP